MEQLIRDAHYELNREVHRLGVAYQLTVDDAALKYQQGLQMAQTRFEEKLHAAELAESLK